MIVESGSIHVVKAAHSTNRHNSCTRWTIDREPSSTQCVTPDSDGGDTGEGGSEGEEEEEEVRGDEGRSGTLRNRWRGQRGGRETGELNIVITSRASISYNIGVWTP